MGAAPSAAKKPPPREERGARQYDLVVAPGFDARFGRLILEALDGGSVLSLLEVDARTGLFSVDLLRALPRSARVVAMDPSAAKMAYARRRSLEDLGQRVFYKVGDALSGGFDDSVFDLVVANRLGGWEKEPLIRLGEAARVLKPGAPLLFSMAARDTFQEVLDMILETSLRHDRPALAKVVHTFMERFPNRDTVEANVRSAGFESVSLLEDTFRLPFPSAAELFADPCLNIVLFDSLRRDLGANADSDLAAAQQSLDTYFGGGALSVTVRAALVSSRAPHR